MSEKQKVKLAVSISDFRIGGAQKVVADILQKIDPATFEVHLVVLFNRVGEETFYDLIPSHIMVHTLHFSGFNDIASWRELKQLLSQMRPDIVWSHLYFSNTVCRLLKLFFTYTVIITEHNTYINKTFFQKCIDHALAYTTAKIVTVSDEVGLFTAAQEHIPKHKFITIQNGVDISGYAVRAASASQDSVRRQLGFSPTDKVILTVGQLIRQKNHQLLVEAFHLFRTTCPEYKLVIIGDGPLRGELQRNIEAYKEDDHVALTGTSKNTADYYALSDFFVLPSLFEGFALVCIEAMACGVPVLTTRVAGPCEYIEHGKNGFFFEPTVEALHKTMTIFANQSDGEKARMRKAAFEKAQQFDIARTVKRYEQLFLEVTRE